LAWTSFDSPAQLFKFDNRTGGKIHPTQKPIQLYEWILSKYANTGQRIMDTHLGSGSSAIAAHNLGFEFVGMELDKSYFDSCVERFNRHCSQQSLFPSGDQRLMQQQILC
jgi:site-specific DNA-methyltransferase (adenine-specific)